MHTPVFWSMAFDEIADPDYADVAVGVLPAHATADPAAWTHRTVKRSRGARSMPTSGPSNWRMSTSATSQGGSDRSEKRLRAHAAGSAVACAGSTPTATSA